MTKKRAEVFEGLGVLKQELYKQAHGAIKGALQNHAWLEAIVTEESIISDRIESYLAAHRNIKEMQPLGRNIERFEKYVNLEFPENRELLADLKEWRTSRNFAVHMMVKIEEGQDLDWSARVNLVKQSAIKGAALANRVKNWSRRKPN